MANQKANSSLPYTAAPWRLFLADLTLWLRITFILPPGGIPSLVFPVGPFNSGILDELYPTAANLWALLLQLILSAVQLGFLLWLVPASLGAVPPFISFYSPIWILLVLGFSLGNRWVSKLLLNGTGRREFSSRIPLTEREKKATERERWIFVNGVAAGEHWMQNNIDRLALTFRREILGLHNETRGIIFDLIECILERTLSWATPSTRIVYTHLLDIVSSEQYDRIVLILHSQGAIEGGLALDWLFATVPAEQLSRVEVYTFGSAANHFNNPVYTSSDKSGVHYQIRESGDGRVLRHIEHYANSGDYVSQFGILNFRPIPGKRSFKLAVDEAQNRFAGRLFVRNGSGHQFNGNYLDNIFSLDSAQENVLDINTYMDSKLDEDLFELADIVTCREQFPSLASAATKERGPEKPDMHNSTRQVSSNKRIKDVSRLWNYRNGGTPID